MHDGGGFLRGVGSGIFGGEVGGVFGGIGGELGLDQRVAAGAELAEFKKQMMQEGGLVGFLIGQDAGEIGRKVSGVGAGKVANHFGVVVEGGELVI